jgi:ATP-dependent RNA helicase DeaD
VADVPRVIHADAPNDHEVYTHRSGRTGRAGKKGTSVLLVPPAMREFAIRLLRRARVDATWSPAPGKEEVQRAIDERIVTELSEPSAQAEPDAPRLQQLADALLEKTDARQLIVRLLSRAKIGGATSPREVAAIMPPRREEERPAPRPSRAGVRGPMPGWQPRGPAARPYDRDRAPNEREQTPSGPPPRRDQERGYDGPLRRDRAVPRPTVKLDFVPFRINWGDFEGADPRRLLALVCRRGNVRGNEVGAIQIGTTESLFEIAAGRADDFLRNARRPDPREPHRRIEPLLGKTFERRAPQRGGGEDRAPERGPERDRGHGRKDRPQPTRAKKRTP